jgi:hypothetical protein
MQHANEILVGVKFTRDHDQLAVHVVDGETGRSITSLLDDDLLQYRTVKLVKRTDVEMRGEELSTWLTNKHYLALPLPQHEFEQVYARLAKTRTGTIYNKGQGLSPESGFDFRSVPNLNAVLTNPVEIVARHLRLVERQDQG